MTGAALVPANVIHRVFKLRVGQGSGTAFAIDVDGRQYLVTAKHVVSGLTGSTQIELLANNSWKPLSVKVVGHSPEVDISVLATDHGLVPPGLPLDPTSAQLTYSQDVFFLGFPYDELSKLSLTEQSYPLPFVKKAIVSSFAGPGVYLLDGHNNPGFSGGPVIFYPPGARSFRVAAVISGFRGRPEPVFAGGQQTPLSYIYNTGIIVAYSIEPAIALIRANPIGFKL